MSNISNLSLLEDLKEVSLDNLTHLPEKTGIYMMASSSGYVYYIGNSTNLRQYLLSYSLSDLHKYDIHKIYYIEAEYTIFYTPSWNQNKDQISNDKISNSKCSSFQEKIDRYLEISNLIEKLEEEKEILKEDITTYANNYKQENGASLTYKNVTISTNQRKTWEYSNIVKELETKIKNLKKIEQKNGLAKVVKLSVYSTIRGK